MTDAMIERIIDALAAVRMPAQPEEYDIHAQVAAALGAAGLPAELTKQLRRYLASDALDAVVVVTQRVTRLPHSIDGKGVYIISLNRLWGVALP